MRTALGLLMGPPATRSPRSTLRPVKRGAERVRRELYESVGSDRHSRPALYEMERKLERHLPHREGFFVEAGANDGFNQSNTYWFERFRGWHGVLVEPVPALAERCRRTRPESEVVNSALVSPDFHGDSVTMSYGNLTSHVKASRGTPEEEIAHLARGAELDEIYEVSVPARTLTSILEDVWAPTIDLLSLDVEGYELEVLRGLDFERFAPRFVLVEVLVERGADRGPVDRLLAERYDWVEDLSHHDSLYRLRDG